MTSPRRSVEVLDTVRPALYYYYYHLIAMGATYGLAKCGSVRLGVGIVVLAIICTAVEPDEVVLRKGMN
jgi:hypothetical protein